MHGDLDQAEGDAEREDSKTDEEASDSDSSEMEAAEEAEDEENEEVGGTELPHGRFRQLESLLGILQDMPDTDARAQVPPGKKENIYFIVTKSKKFRMLKKQELPSQFFDDHGACQAIL